MKCRGASLGFVSGVTIQVRLLSQDSVVGQTLPLDGPYYTSTLCIFVSSIDSYESISRSSLLFVVPLI